MREDIASSLINKRITTERGDFVYYENNKPLTTKDKEILDLYLDIEIEKFKDKENSRELKIQGKPYTDGGPNISFTKNDAVGVLQVKAAFALGIHNTTLEFDNETKLPIRAEDFQDFFSWYMKERLSFF
jgi:hypothetical protein